MLTDQRALEKSEGPLKRTKPIPGGMPKAQGCFTILRRNVWTLCVDGKTLRTVTGLLATCWAYCDFAS